MIRDQTPNTNQQRNTGSYYYPSADFFLPLLLKPLEVLTRIERRARRPMIEPRFTTIGTEGKRRRVGWVRHGSRHARRGEGRKPSSASQYEWETKKMKRDGDLEREERGDETKK